MIDDLDRSLGLLLELEFGNPLPFDVSFAIPDKAFKPVSAQRPTLNCYLYDIRENRELRDLWRSLDRLPGGGYTLDSEPCRVRAAYCITAWSPAPVAANTDPHLDEHLLLASVLRLLLRYPEFPPEQLAGALANPGSPLPTQIAQPDSARNSGDFWNAIGGQLRPSLEYSVTIAMDYRVAESGRLVDTVQARFGLHDPNAIPRLPTTDTRQVVGGTVWNGNPDASPVPGAWVRVDETGELSVADAAGRFVFERVATGIYTVTVRATGFQQASQSLVVPLVAGSHDINLTPL